MGRTRWSFPSFNPDALDRYTLRSAYVTHWKRPDLFLVSIVVTDSLRNENQLSSFLAKRLRLGFECESSPMFVRKAMIIESTVTFEIAFSPRNAEHFRAKQPILHQSVRDPNVKQRLSDYELRELEPPNPDHVDDDIPF